MLEDIHKVVPSNGVKSLFDIKLEEKARRVGALEFPCKVPDIHVVVMDATFLDESTLGIGDKGVHEGGKA